MKLHEYNDMMAHLTRRRLMSNGGPIGNVDLSRGTPSITDNKDFQNKVKKLRADKKTVGEIAKELNVSIATVERTLKKVGDAGKRTKDVVAQEKLKEAYDKFVKDTGKIPRIQDMRNAGLSQEAIERAQREGFEFGRRGEGKGSAKAKVVNDDLIAMSKSDKIKKALADEIIPNVQDVIKVTSATDEASALNRLVQLSGAITEGKKGLDLKLDNYKKGAKLILDNADVLNEQIRTVAEESIGKSVGEETTRNPRKNISRQKITPGYAIDEPAGVMSSYRRGTQPYGIFSQIIGSDINVGDKFSFDAYKSIKEKEIQMAKGKEKVKKINEFNKGISKYEKILNEDRKPGELKVRLFRASTKNPSQTIKRFSEFPASYQKAFTNNYKKLGYSFEVPKDVKTIFEIREDIKDPKIRKQIAEGVEAGSPRVYGGIPLKPLGKAALTAAEVAGTPAAAALFAADTVRRNIREGQSLADAVVDPMVGVDLLLPTAASRVAPGVMKGVLGLGKVGRAFTPIGAGLAIAGQAQEFYNQFQELQRLKEEDPEAYEQFIASRVTDPLTAEELADIEDMGREGAMYGGRVGFADGPEDPSRRSFVKMMGILAALPYGIGKLVSKTEPIIPVIKQGAKIGYDKFLELAAKIKILGKKDPGRTTMDRQEVTVYRGKDGSEYELTEDITTGDVRITRDKPGMAQSGDEVYDTIEDRTTMEYKKGSTDIDPKTGKKVEYPDEYEEVKEVAGPDGTFDDIDEVDDIIAKEIDEEIK